MLKIYVTDLSAFNTGFLLGEFITLPMDKEELASRVKMILGKGEILCNDSFHEEYFITDYEFETVDIFLLVSMIIYILSMKKLDFLKI